MFVNTEIITAFIALMGVIISILASLYVNSRQTNTEIEKLRHEIQYTYIGKLIEKRIEVYPSLYKLLSDLDKVLRFGTFSKEVAAELFNKISLWDSNNALFLSSISGLEYHRFRMVVAKIVNMSDEEFSETYSDKDATDILRKAANKVEVSLKSDIGVFIPESSDTKVRFSSYSDVSNTVGNAKHPR